MHVASASPYEPHLVPATLDTWFLADLPTRLIGDRGYDSDRLDEPLMTTCGIEMIAANRRRRVPTRDGRPLRRARRRWKVERFCAWLHNSRRVVTRWERLCVSNSLSGRHWKLDQVPAVGDPTHIVQLGIGYLVSAGEGQWRVALQ